VCMNVMCVFGLCIVHYGFVMMEIVTGQSQKVLARGQKRKNLLATLAPFITMLQIAQMIGFFFPYLRFLYISVSESQNIWFFCCLLSEFPSDLILFYQAAWEC